MRNHMSDLLSTILDGTGNPALWVAGDLPELRDAAEWVVLDDPGALIDEAGRLVDARVADAAQTEVRPVHLVLDARSVAAATATAETWCKVDALAQQGPDAGVHCVLARSGADPLRGADFALLVRLLGDLRRGVDLGPAAIIAADPQYMSALFSLSASTAGDALSQALGAPHTSASPVVVAVREVLHAAEGLWTAGLLDRARSMTNPPPRGPVVWLQDEAGPLFAQAKDNAPKLGQTPGGKATSVRKVLETMTREARGATLYRRDDFVWLADLKRVPTQQWSGPDESLLFSLHAEAVRRGHSAAELGDMETTRQQLGMDDSAPYRAVRLLMLAVDGEQRWHEDGIRGRDEAETLANARWNWPAALDVVYLGHLYEVGDEVVELDAPHRAGRVRAVRPNIEGRPADTLLVVRFAGDDSDTELTRDRIRFTGSSPDSLGEGQ